MRAKTSGRRTLPGESAQERAVTQLVVSKLGSGYGGALVIEDVDLSIEAGRISTIIGPNGSGKSTLIKTIAGVLRAAAGEVTLDGRNVTRLRPDQLVRLGVGYVPQSRDVFDGLTVKENLDMGGYLLPRDEVAPRMREIVELFPLLEPLLGRRVNKLSGGERKMVAIGRVLMLRPRVLLLDEPTAGLAPELAHTVLATYVRKIADDGSAVLLVEQRATEALQIADVGHVLVSGRIQISAPSSELLTREDVGEMFLGRLPEEARIQDEHLALGLFENDPRAAEPAVSNERGGEK